MTAHPATSAMQLNCEVTDFLWPWSTSTPVLMVHGFSRNAVVWTRWLPYLGQDHRVYRADLPGMGASPALPSGQDWSVQALNDAFLGVLDRYGLERIHWVGESSGGMLGALFAAAHPGRVASLVLVETPLRRNAALKQEHNLGEARPNASWAVREYGLREYSRRTIGARLDLSKASPELIEWYIGLVAGTSADVAAGFKEFVDTLDIEPVLKAVKAPALLLCGDKSRVLTADQVETVRKTMPNVEIREFAGYGHGLPVLAPEECSNESRAFWKKHPG